MVKGYNLKKIKKVQVEKEEQVSIICDICGDESTKPFYFEYEQNSSTVNESIHISYRKHSVGQDHHGDTKYYNYDYDYDICHKCYKKHLENLLYNVKYKKKQIKEKYEIKNEVQEKYEIK